MTNKRRLRTVATHKVKIFVSDDGFPQRISSLETVDDVTLADCLCAVIPRKQLAEYLIHIDLSAVDLSMTVGDAAEVFRVPSGRILVVCARHICDKGGI